MSGNKLTEMPYEKIAMAGGEMPCGLKYYDQMTFQRLRMLYNAYKQQIVSREVATREKAEILRERDNLKFMCDLFEENVEMTKKTELIIADFRKTNSIELAHTLCDVLDGRKVNI